jgi:AAA+ superfamily predicted ATPase
MLFYQVKVACSLVDNGKMQKNYEESQNAWHRLIEDINDTLETDANESKIFMTVYKASPEELFLIAVIDSLESPTPKTLLDFFADIISEKYGLSLQRKAPMKEISPKEARKFLENSSHFISRNRYWDNDNYSLDYYNNRDFQITEQIFDNFPTNLNAALEDAHTFIPDKTLLEEIKRIYTPTHPHKYQGHPVHYKLSADNKNSALQLATCLCRNLYANQRLVSRCISYISDITEGCFNDSDIESIFRQSAGGTIVIELTGSKEEHQNYTTCYEEVVNFFTKQIRKYQRNTLFILVENTHNPGFTHNLISSLQEEMFFIEIKEGTGNRQTAAKYLQKLLTDGKISYNTEQIEYVLGDKTVFRPSDIYQMYDRLYRNNLRNNAYTAYKEVSRVTLAVKKHAEKDAYSRLQSMIGLQEVKKVIENILDTFRAQKIRSTMGLNQFRPNMHMVFTGNPGSAKTTVARLLSEILNSEGILSSGEFVECGRADLVGKYVGWTAPTIKKKFRHAEGGILFIDEAYSLVDDCDGSYGDEAINTIVQEMENNRDDTIVIFAGYPDKMERFLEKNEGLRSRIAFHLDFPDYTPEELLDILKLHAKKREYTLSEDALKTCLEIFTEASAHANYGNGRYVRSFLEQAVIRQSERILNSDNDKGLNADEMCLLKPEDFKAVSLGFTDEDEKKVGFAV